MGFRHSIVFIFAVISSTLAFTAEYVPKSYYVIHNGVQSPRVFIRDKRSLQELVPFSRMRRSDSGSSSGAGSYSGSFASSSAGAGAGGGPGGEGLFFPDNFQAGFEMVKKLSGFPNGFPGFPGGIPGGFPEPQGYGAGAGTGFAGKDGQSGVQANGISPDLHSRFGGDDGVSYSGSAQGAHGVYSGSSSSIDSDGNVKYSAKSGKFPDLHSRFGGDDGVSYSGSAEGARGVYSGSSSSIDSDGNVKYSAKSGKLY